MKELPTHVDWIALIRMMSREAGSLNKLSPVVGVSRQSLSLFVMGVREPSISRGIRILYHSIDFIPVHEVMYTINSPAMPELPMSIDFVSIIREIKKDYRYREVVKIARDLELSPGTVRHWFLQNTQDPWYRKGVGAFNLGIKVLGPKIDEYIIYE